MATDDASNPWSASGWSVTGQMNYHKQHGPARAAARARDAGTTVGGKRPKGAGSGGGNGGGGDGGDGPQRTAIIKHISSGWSPVLAAVDDGARRVLRVIAWTGGQGGQPVVGKYLGPNGFVDTAAAATDIGGSGNHLLFSLALGG
jgi:hypothetical protein